LDSIEMNLTKALRDHWLRIDARSLGLFRLAFGVVLFADLLRRWRYLKPFYSNDGVLPNHNHLFNLRDHGQVWSVLHAFSSVPENQTAFCFILFFYACFFLGWHTRVFHVLSLACLVSLDARNILLENAGDHLAIALLAFTAFLPLGSRFSVDSFLASMSARDEKSPRALSDRRRPSPESVQAARVPGWSPTSLAAFAVVAQIEIVYLAMGLQQKSSTWHAGTALYYALNSERLVSALGASARGLPLAVLAAWARAFRVAELAIPALLVIPVGVRATRGVAVGLVLFTGLTLGVFFSFGIFGWSLVAAAALLVPGETWDRVEEHAVPRRARTVIYDVDCGVCLWLSRVLKRLDLRGNLTFQGNDDLEGLVTMGGAETPPKPPQGSVLASIERRALPAEVTSSLVESTVVVVDPRGRVSTRARAVAEVVGALPLGWLVAWAMKLPGVVQLLGVMYDLVATRRQRISVAMGKGACGIEGPHAEEPAAPELAAPAPSTRLRRGLTGAARDLAALVLLAAAVAQTTAANDLPWQVPQPKWLAAVAAWPRMLAQWNVLATPPAEDEVFVVDAQTRGGRSIDPLTGSEPVLDPGAMRGTGLGQLWNDYLDRIRQREWNEYQRAFRDYLAKGGPGWDEQQGDNQIVGLDAYWVKQPIPEPGQPRPDGLSARDKVFTQSRGGRLNAAKSGLPLLRPEMFNKR
jgi:predicted DCC family thiol-disulfide oxidoreductase YuxK